MDSIYVGIFAVAADHLAELIRLSKRWLESLDRLEDDYKVRENELYRFAVATAQHRVELPGKDVHSALVACDGFLWREIQYDKEQLVFFPEAAQALLHDVTKLERRLGGEDAMVGRVAKLTSKAAPEAIHRAYRAYKEVLHAAVELGAGFTWAVLDENAEAALEEKRRKWQLAMEESNARPRLTEKELAEARAKLDALKEAGAMALVNRQIKASERQDRRNASRTNIRHARFYLLPKRKMRAVRRLMNQSLEYKNAGKWAEVDAPRQAARALAAASAVECIALDKLGEARAVAELYAMLCHMTRKAYERSDVYSAAQVMHFLRSLEVWEAQCGERAIQDELATFCRGKQRQMVAHAYHTFKDVLRTVLERDLGLMIDDVILTQGE